MPTTLPPATRAARPCPAPCPRPSPPAPRPPPLERPPFDWRDRRTWRQAAGVARAWAAHHALPSLTASRLKWTVRGVAAPSGAPAYELQGIGGDGSVRGYDGGQIGRAHASATTSVELSMPFLSAPPVPRDQVIPSRPPPPSRQMPISLALFADAGGGLTKRARESSLLRHGVLQSAGAAVDNFGGKPPWMFGMYGEAKTVLEDDSNAKEAELLLKLPSDGKRTTGLRSHLKNFGRKGDVFGAFRSHHNRQICAEWMGDGLKRLTQTP